MFLEVCVLLSLPRPLSKLLHILVPPIALHTPLLPWTVWLVPVPLSLPSSWVPRLCPPSRLIGPAVFVVVHRCLACLVLPTRSAMTRFAFLVCMALVPLSPLPMLLLPRSPTVMTKFSFRTSHTVLLWFCVIVMLRFLSRALVFLAFPPPPTLILFARNLPCRLAAVADALLGTINSDMLLLLLRSHWRMPAMLCAIPSPEGAQTMMTVTSPGPPMWPCCCEHQLCNALFKA
jgi:hypothetical protein